MYENHETRRSNSALIARLGLKRCQDDDRFLFMVMTAPTGGFDSRLVLEWLVLVVEECSLFEQGAETEERKHSAEQSFRF